MKVQDRAMLSAAELTLADTGAGRPILASKRYALAGSLRKNTTTISTANGVTTPEWACDARLPMLLRRKGAAPRIVHVVVRDAIIVPQCAHNLVPVGAMARTHGLGLRVAPWTGEASLVVENRGIGPVGSSIQLLNMGVLVFAAGGDGEAFGGVTHGSAGTTAKVTYEDLHQRVMHRGDYNISNLHRCSSDVPPSWARLVPSPSDRPACDSCLRAQKRRMPAPPGSHAPAVTKCGQLVSFDVYTVSVPYRWGGAQKVFSIHDHFSQRDFPYLIKSEAECPSCLLDFFALARDAGHCVAHCHTDNAKIFANEGVLTATCRRVCKEARFDGIPVRFTTCSEYTPRQNGVCERQWQTMGCDTRKGLCHAGAPRNLWWDCLEASCDTASRLPIPGSPDESPLSRWRKGRKGRFATVVRSWGVLCYPKIYDAKSKVHDQSVRCMLLGRARDQPGWRCLDPLTGRVHVSPDVDFAEGSFPGLTVARDGREQIVPSSAPDYDADAPRVGGLTQPFAPADPTTGPRVETGTWPAAAPAAARPRDAASGPADPISQRLTRVRQPVQRLGFYGAEHGAYFGAELRDQACSVAQVAQCVDTPIEVPAAGLYVVYLCCGPRRAGDHRKARRSRLARRLGCSVGLSACAYQQAALAAMAAALWWGFRLRAGRGGS